MAKEKKITLINQSRRTFQTSLGEFAIGRSMEFDETEAQSLMDYPGIVDAANYVSASAADEKLKDQNLKLKGENGVLAKKLEDAHAVVQKQSVEIDQLTAQVKELKEKIEDLGKKAGKKK